jgi:hypothetical protein
LAVGRAVEVQANRALTAPIERASLGGERELVNRRPSDEIDVVPSRAVVRGT